MPSTPYMKLYVGDYLADTGRSILLHEIDQFGLTAVLDAMDITRMKNQIRPNERLRYMAGICWNKKRGQ